MEGLIFRIFRYLVYAYEEESWSLEAKQSHMGQTHQAGEQQTKWSKGSKELESLNKLISFLFKVPDKVSEVFS